MYVLGRLLVLFFSPVASASFVPNVHYLTYLCSWRINDDDNDDDVMPWL